MIYAIDFDGTIVENAFPAIGELKPAAERFIREIHRKGDKWILYTMREGKYLEEALAFLAEIGLSPDAANDNLPEMCEFYKNNPRKIFANVYIDDHNAGGLRFEYAMRKAAGEQMSKETKEIFGEPWKVTEYCSGTITVRTQTDFVCRCSNNEKGRKYAKRIERIPELYDALNKQAYYRCVDCLRITANTIDDIPLNKDMIECGCPRHRTDCGAFDVWQLLKKVRDGK